MIKIDKDKIIEDKYNELVNELAGLFFDIMTTSKRRRYINAVLDRVTEENEEVVKELFDFAQKEGDIPKDLKYSRENFVKALDESHLIE